MQPETEFYVTDAVHGSDIDEKDRRWNTMRGLGRATAIGIKIAGARVPGGHIPIPPTAKGMVQCRYATVRDGITTTEMHIVGFIDAAGNYHLSQFHARTGKPVDLPPQALEWDMTPHTVLF